ncbi:MAG: beta-lactamase family protein [Firmicutes bacterium]|nr:beta-lactamase family protein [Bacillota bacterium]
MNREKNEILNELIESSGFNGVCLIAEEGEIIYANAHGMANFEHQVPNTLQTKFRIASITKQFTAAAILQLVEQQKLTVSDPVSKYIPDYPHGSIITIHHLLTHTSGIPNFNLDDDFYHVFHSENYQEALIDLFKHQPLQFDPGSNFAYSVSGFLILGYIIEKVSNQRYLEYLKEHIFYPLQMNDSGYDYYQELVIGRANGYSKIGDILENAEFIDMRIAGAGGGLYSTVLDLLKWNNGLFGSTIISKESLELMLSKHVILSDHDSSGYGMFRSESVINDKQRTMFYHSGGGIGVRSFNMYFMEDQMQVILITNVNDKDTFESVRSLISEIIFN